MSPTLDVNLTLFVIHCEKGLGIIDLHWLSLNKGIFIYTSSILLCFKIKVTFEKIHVLKVIFHIFSTKLCALHSSHEALSSEIRMSIAKSKAFGANFTKSLQFWADGTKVHKTTLMCVDAVEPKYQIVK